MRLDRKRILKLGPGFGLVFGITNGCHDGFVEFEVEKTCHLCRLKRKAEGVINKETTKEHSGMVSSLLNTNVS